MLDTLIEVSTKLLDLIAPLYNLITTSIFDLGYDLLTSLGGTGDLWFEFFDWLRDTDIVRLLNIDVFKITFLGFVLGPGIYLILAFAVVLFVLNIVDKLIPV